MTPDPLTDEEKKTLLGLARQALEAGVNRRPLPRLDLAALTPHLSEPGASFVTLTIEGGLRGCIGSLEASQALAEDVRERAVEAALNDPRFPPVRPEELPCITVEVSRLTRPEPLEYGPPEELLKRLNPGVDGVVLMDEFRRATFLPQVWEKLPDPAEFLDHLCYKMGLEPQTWRRKHLEVLVYAVEDFHE